VRVHYLGLTVSQLLFQRSFPFQGIESVKGRPNLLGGSLDGIVIGLQESNFMPSGSEHLDLRAYDCIFATVLLVTIVKDQYSQLASLRQNHGCHASFNEQRWNLTNVFQNEIYR
jgi:hypothetical protein